MSDSAFRTAKYPGYTTAELAVTKALEIIEGLGGMDPKQRGGGVKRPLPLLRPVTPTEFMNSLTPEQVIRVYDIIDPDPPTQADREKFDAMSDEDLIRVLRS